MCLGDISTAGLIPTSSSTITEPVIKPTVAKSNKVADVMSSSSLVGAALLSLLITNKDGDGAKIAEGVGRCRAAPDSKEGA